jgi:ubiquinone/menaquinone biosynthesis C-methylase UbiE
MKSALTKVKWAMPGEPQYDRIAEEYQQAKRLPFFEVIEYSLFVFLGDIRGRSVLDLACGEGFNTRRLKAIGAARAVGVDISTEMIRLAREQEEREPLGIEYRVSAAQELPIIDQFDAVTAVFLLNYAESTQELLDMCRAVYRNLKPGHRFLAITDTWGSGTANGETFRPYGFAYPGDRPCRDGDAVTVNLRIDAVNWVQLGTRNFHPETYERTLKAAGFRKVDWRNLAIPEELAIRYGTDFWAPLVTERPIALIECVK